MHLRSHWSWDLGHQCHIQMHSDEHGQRYELREGQLLKTEMLLVGVRNNKFERQTSIENSEA